MDGVFVFAWDFGWDFVGICCLLFVVVVVVVAAGYLTS